MKLANKALPIFPPTRVIAWMVALMLIGGISIQAQTPQLSLADLLIGLRSRKASLPERNTILTEAVRQRGVTFTMTPEIEKELETTGASPTLIEAIRLKAPVVKPEPTPAVVVPVATPVPTPTPPDFSFYQTRADQAAVKGEFAVALVDYNKSLEMKADNAPAYLSRGKAHFSLKSYDLSVKDFDKVLELNPKDSVALLNRGLSYERLGETKKAMGDYLRAVTLDPANETAKANLKRLQDAEIAAAAAEAAKNAPPPFVNLGNLTPSHAIRMATPLYSPVAQRANVEGRVTVEVELDEKGEVVSAKATSGPSMLRASAEDAANRSKFKPALFNNRPIKAKGVITYNFSLKQPARE